MCKMETKTRHPCEICIYFRFNNTQTWNMKFGVFRGYKFCVIILVLVD